MTGEQPRAWGPPPSSWLTQHAPAWAYGVYVVLCLFDSQRNSGPLAVAVGVVAGIACYPFVRRHLRGPQPGLVWTLTAQAALTYLPLLAGSRWIGFGGFLAAAFLSTVRRPWGPLLALAVAAAGFVLIGFIPGEQYLAMGDILSLMLGYYLLAHLPRAIAELRESQGAAEKLAAARERLRMSRDLHDLLGRGLVTVAVKSELAAELLRAGHPKAAAEIASIAEVTRQAQSELAALAADRSVLDLAVELAAAADLLRAAGVAVEVSLDDHHGKLPPGDADVLAWAVREGVTNVLQHSKATTCELSLVVRGAAGTLTLVNDGATEIDGHDDGIGLAGQAERVAARGGRISAGYRPGGRYALVVEVPVR